MPINPKHAFKEKSTKLLILLPLRTIYNRTFQCETPCSSSWDYSSRNSSSWDYSSLNSSSRDYSSQNSSSQGYFHSFWLIFSFDILNFFIINFLIFVYLISILRITMSKIPFIWIICSLVKKKKITHEISPFSRLMSYHDMHRPNCKCDSCDLRTLDDVLYIVILKIFISWQKCKN